MDCTIIGIAGGSGAGKSRLTERLKEKFGDNITVIYHDNYYRRHDNMSFEERKLLNYDHPDSLETDMLVEHLKKLKKGESIECPVYDFSIHNRTDDTFTINPSKIIIVEGILVFYDERLRNLFDIKIYVDADADVRIIRRIIRDVKERGRDIDGIAAQYLNTVKPMHYLFVEPTKYTADIVLEDVDRKPAFDMISTKIERILENG